MTASTLKKVTVATVETIDGNSLDVTGYELGVGEQAVYIQGGMHGGEVTYWIFHRLVNILQQKQLKKKVTLVPLCNPFSWQQKSYFYTVGKFSMIDGKDWLWSFPGLTSGSPMQRLAAQLYGVASKHALSVDLHTSRKSVPFGIFSATTYESELKALAIPYNFVSTYGDSPDQLKQGVASLSYAMSMNGQRGFTLECGSHDTFNEANIQSMCDSIVNLLRLEGVLDEPVQAPGDFITFDDAHFGKYRADHTGFVTYEKSPGETFSPGDVLFTVLPANSLTDVHQVKATENGIVLKVSPTHIAQAGDVMVEVIRRDHV